MIVANAEPRYGLDTKLYKIQQYIDKKMPTAIIYALLHENQREQGKILEWSPLETEVFVDDREELIIGFRLINKKVSNFEGLATLDVICTTSTTNRELTELNVYKLLQNSGLINTIDTNIKIGIDDVFTGLFNDAIRFRDIYPFHVFAYTITTPYTYNAPCPS